MILWFRKDGNCVGLLPLHPYDQVARPECRAYNAEYSRNETLIAQTSYSVYGARILLIQTGSGICLEGVRPR